MTSFTWSRTFNGSPAIGAPVKGPGQQIYAGGGQGSTSNSASATEQVTFKGTWTADPNLASDPVPSSVIVEINTQAESYTIVNGTSTPGTDANDGKGDPINSSGIASGTHYKVETGSSFTESLSLEASATNSSGFAYAGVGGVSVSVVNGNWDGPYYFHKGQYAQGVQSQPTTSPWYNNMAGDYPTGTDTYDGNNIFQLQETTKPFAESSGTIIPVWVWSGPNLPGGTAPPAFSINETTDALAEDETNGGGTDWDVDDGQGNTYVTNTQNEDYVLDTKPNVTTVSSFTTASGSVWWALGQPFNLTASANGFGVYPPYDYYVYVGMSAAMASQ